MKFSSWRPMPRIYSAFTAAPILGAGSMASGAISKTSRTESTSAPMTVRSPSKSISTMMMQVSTVSEPLDMPSLRRMSTTGTA
jgi:hypothetical protein